MSFRDIRLPVNIRITSGGGPEFYTEIAASTAGVEARNITRDQAIRKYQIDYVQEQAGLDQLLAFFHIVHGSGYAFRFKDWTNFTVTFTEGVIGGGEGNGAPTLPLVYRYAFGAYIHDRFITKPVNGTLTIKRGAATMVFGVGSGQVSIDYSTGLASFGADSSQVISGHTPGAQHVFTTSTDLAPLQIGEYIHISGITGTAASVLNCASDQAWLITNKTGSGPVTWTIDRNTSGLTASGGSAYAFPQANDILTWQGEFDVCCRFDTDKFNAVGVSGTNIYQIAGLTLSEDLTA